jgi:NAD(P)-dependent dehydrogenase (short-subunit alcohol dehydrogenase family)
MDLDSLASVRKAAAEVASWEDVAIDVLINNAAVMAAPYSTTKDGFESQFGVGHLGHFLFTCLLLKANKIKSGGRIVNVSSAGHRLGPVRFDDPGFTVCLFFCIFSF